MPLLDLTLNSFVLITLTQEIQGERRWLLGYAGRNSPAGDCSTWCLKLVLQVREKEIAIINLGNRWSEN